jgi:hypothetical protein
MDQTFVKAFVEMSGSSAVGIFADGSGAYFELGEGTHQDGDLQRGCPRTKDEIENHLFLNENKVFRIVDVTNVDIRRLMHSLHLQNELALSVFARGERIEVADEAALVKIGELLGEVRPPGHLGPEDSLAAMTCLRDWLRNWSRSDLEQHIPQLRTAGAPYRLITVLEGCLERYDLIGLLLSWWKDEVKLYEGDREYYTICFTKRGVFLRILTARSELHNSATRDGIVAALHRLLDEDLVLRAMVDPDHPTDPNRPRHEALDRLLRKIPING